MVSSSTSESDSLPVSSACKAQRWYESQSRRLNSEGEKIFHASRGWMGTTRFYALPSAVPVPIQNCFLRPCTVSAPPSSTFLDPPLRLNVLPSLQPSSADSLQGRRQVCNSMPLQFVLVHQNCVKSGEGNKPDI